MRDLATVGPRRQLLSPTLDSLYEFAQSFKIKLMNALRLRSTTTVAVKKVFGIRTLPDELLVMVIAYLSESEHLILQRTARRFFLLSAFSPADADDLELARFVTLLRREEHKLYLQQEALGLLNPQPERLSCWSCGCLHARAHFADEKLTVPTAYRSCKLTDRLLPICEHLSITYEGALTVATLVREGYSQGRYGPPAQKLRYTCHHPSHRRLDGAREMYVEIESAPSSASGTVEVRVVEEEYAVGRASITSSLRSRYEAILHTARGTQMSGRLCNHLSHPNTTYGDFYLGTPRTPSFRDLFDPQKVPDIPAGDSYIGSRCSRCTMRYWFTFGEYLEGPEHPARQHVFVYLNVARSEFSLPVDVSSRPWMISTIPPGQYQERAYLQANSQNERPSELKPQLRTTLLVPWWL